MYLVTGNLLILNLCWGLFSRSVLFWTDSSKQNASKIILSTELLSGWR